MALKIIFIFTLSFIIRAKTNKIEFEQTSTPAPKENYSPEYLDAFINMDNFAALLTFSEMETPLRERYPKAISCYQKEKQIYEKFVTKFNRKTKEAIETISETLKSKYQKFGETGKKNLKKIIGIMNKYPRNLSKFIKRKKYDRAADIMSERRAEMEGYLAKFEANLRQLEKKSQEAAEKAKVANEIFDNVRQEFKKEGNIIAENYRKCLEINPDLPNLIPE